ncbi:rubredoxin domain-containing protein [Mucilaginibacter paludis]|uniref:Rubredoxin-type Fe(Cys)4 protein n=1 Tax=Mucilaginibacter paludis DSM 18603 TaxID=714943 RepID=H1Y7V4_9SPHI|nr:rubredoxin domain-containing protein [Mucilaginibacter paludis]EHQ30440.1 Rubredoxin-type Fe(Cys)4 protein [Mucilaginibacter paludis DSM 18603]
MQNSNQHLIKINLPGGVISAGDFYEILIIAQKAGAQHIRFGNRQQLYFTIVAEQLEDMELDMLSAEIDYEIDGDLYPNILSSYIADYLFNQDNWLKEGVYKDVFSLFSHRPKLKINVVDSNQTFVPFFTGHLNFISSDVSNYWYLYVRYPQTNTLYCWPSLIYSDDIAGLCKVIEETIDANAGLFYAEPGANSELFYQLVNQRAGLVVQQINQPLQIPEFHLPYYEGINRQGNKYWLGIYRRDELFAIEFLKELCHCCMQTRLGQLYVSPWKSILIKNIDLADRDIWGNLLNQHRMNVRHASNELNWQVEDLCDEGLALKRQLVREFEEADIRTYRLSFAVKVKPAAVPFAAIVIQKQVNGLFDILHQPDFNPNLNGLIPYRESVIAAELSRYLIQLCNHFYETCSHHQNTLPPLQPGQLTPPVVKQVYQCQSCQTVYDEQYGDDWNNIAPGVKFEDISNYRCSTCDAPKQNFVPAHLNQ